MSLRRALLVCAALVAAFLLLVLASSGVDERAFDYLAR